MKYPVIPIEEIDKNLVVRDEVPEGTVFYDPKKPPFAIYGLYHPLEESVFLRLPEDFAASVNPFIYNLAHYTAGGRIRFKTDSPYIVVRVYQCATVKTKPHMAATGSRGCDLYEKTEGEYRYTGSLIPPPIESEGYVSLFTFPKETRMRDLVLNLPLYNHVRRIDIGLAEGSHLEPGSRYRQMKPLVFYGSSITEGGCASRPGSCYTSIVSHRLDCDHINLGFSGRAKGEVAMAEYIASLDMSVFIMDYDYNSTTKNLERTHWEFYSAFRRLRPEVPILMATKIQPETEAETDTLERLAMIRRNYEKAIAAGDTRLRLLDNHKLFSAYPSGCTVDGHHPTDLGFYLMAQAFYPEIKALLEMVP